MGGVPAGVERAHQLAAHLVHDGEALPGVDRGGGHAARLGDLEQVVRFSFGVFEPPFERVARGQGRGAAGFFVDQT